MKKLAFPFVATAALALSASAFEQDATPAVPVLPPATGVQQSQVGPAGTQVPESTTMVVTNRPIALRVVGSNVKNIKGEFLGRLDTVTLHPDTKQIEYAMLDIDYPTNTGRVTPVPWNLLNYVWDQSQAGGLPGAVQVFRLDLDRSRLALAPSIEKNQVTLLMQPEFRQQLVGFYGTGSEYAIGGTGATSTTVTGGAASTPGPGEVPIETFVLGQSGVAAVATNGTNRVVATNTVVDTNLFPGATNPFVSTNIAPGATNVFSGGTNVFNSPTNILAGTNIFPGAPATPPVGAAGTNSVLLPPTGRTVVNPNTPQATQPRRTAPGQPSPFTPPSQVVIPVPPPTTTPPQSTPPATTPTPIAPPATVPPSTTPTPIAPPNR